MVQNAYGYNAIVKLIGDTPIPVKDQGGIHLRSFACWFYGVTPPSLNWIVLVVLSIIA